MIQPTGKIDIDQPKSRQRKRFRSIISTFDWIAADTCKVGVTILRYNPLDELISTSIKAEDNRYRLIILSFNIINMINSDQYKSSSEQVVRCVPPPPIFPIKTTWRQYTAYAFSDTFSVLRHLNLPLYHWLASLCSIAESPAVSRCSKTNSVWPRQIFALYSSVARNFA